MHSLWLGWHDCGAYYARHNIDAASRVLLIIQHVSATGLCWPSFVQVCHEMVVKFFFFLLPRECQVRTSAMHPFILWNSEWECYCCPNTTRIGGASWIHCSAVVLLLVSAHLCDVIGSFATWSNLFNGIIKHVQGHQIWVTKNARTLKANSAENRCFWLLWDISPLLSHSNSGLTPFPAP